MKTFVCDYFYFCYLATVKNTFYLTTYIKSCSFIFCLFAWFHVTLPVKAVQSAWCYLCGVIQRSIWTETGELPSVFVTPVIRTGNTAAALFVTFLPNAASVPYTSYELSLHKAAAVSSSGTDPSVLSAPQGFYCEHSRSDSCLQARVGAGNVVSNNFLSHSDCLQQLGNNRTAW